MRESKNPLDNQNHRWQTSWGIFKDLLSSSPFSFFFMKIDAFAFAFICRGIVSTFPCDRFIISTFNGSRLFMPPEELRFSAKYTALRSADEARAISAYVSFPSFMFCAQGKILYFSRRKDRRVAYEKDRRENRKILWIDHRWGTSWGIFKDLFSSFSFSFFSWKSAFAFTFCRGIVSAFSYDRFILSAEAEDYR